MRKGLLIIICLISIKTFAQKDFTTVYYITQKDCKESIRFAKNKVAVGSEFPITSDTVVLNIHKKYSGFIVYYNGKSQMFDIEFQPEGYYKITDAECLNPMMDFKELIGSSGSFKSPVELSFGGEYPIDELKLKEAKYYLIHDFKGKDLSKLTSTNTLETFKNLKYGYIEVNEEIVSKKKDLIYIIKDGKSLFYYHLL